MRSIRASSVVALILLGLYFVLRFAAAKCGGAQCDGYIWPSLVLPIAVLLVVANTGRLAIVDALRHRRSWVAPLGVATAFGVVGPIIAVLVFRDQPDSVVSVAAALFLLAPVAALAYTLRTASSPAS